MNDKLIRQISVTLGLILFAILKTFESQIPDLYFWALPGGTVASDSAPLGFKFLAATFVGFKLGAVIVIAEQVLYRVSARRIIGTWAYKSSSGNYGIASIVPRGFWAGGTTLDYRVELYKSAHQVIRALDKQGGAVPFGTAESLLSSLKDDKVTVVYQVNVGASTYDAKKGILTIKSSHDPNVLTGIWESTKINSSPSVESEKACRQGDLEFYKLERFRKIFGSQSAMGID